MTDHIDVIQSDREAIARELVDAMRQIDAHVSHGRLGDWSIALDEIRKITTAALKTTAS